MVEMNKKQVNVGMVGYKFMGKAHSNAYSRVNMFFPNAPAAPVMKLICGRDREGVEQAAKQFGWEGFVTDWRELLSGDDIDLVDINAPSNAHKEIAMAAARAGKHIFCEKPLALNLADSREMLEAAEEAGIKHMVGFNYRFAPAVQLAKKIISEGRLGTLYHFRAWFLQDWILDPEFPLVWRLQKDVAGSGSHGDLGAHLIDLAHYLVGDMSEVVGMSETFIKDRPMPTSMTGLSAKGSADAPRGKVDVDDATLFLARFANGALGSFEASRFAAGHRCTNSFEINGSKGSIKFDFERLNELEVYFTDDAADVQGFRRVLATDPAHAYMDAWWPPGHTIGYEHTFVHEMLEMMQAIHEDRQPEPNFTDGVKCQQVLEAVELSVSERRWVKVNEL
ncbi:Gfo/Idh/MocA family protein [Paenibacillus radicis (ex Xue et al. 2023)]|uniref:Gfo/Idh/MocA family oxidoreductase n=1 Tax=Paenibacillus radicis (ex Xue et al. 2023) TaxID=2972489 RepID=A0ABT1YJ47_9BACL|nr:Gfo/Idh/MocA family oxidoreductase [Paenibacillus radicis (ex Xue et al. 2023)]MCR8632293.1 Gfo/Idh/MocA family oxidoreductase [Paenibacillus radicis (ex Xue et al. 2023)]